jgi:aminoethylphosphonate catabolism LysR family transcriptional regulator
MIHTQLRSFHAVAEEGGFTAAARALNIGQPTVTSQVKALEALYGVELFHRRGRRVSLTEAGAALHALTTRLTSLTEEARDLLNAYGGFQSGHLKVGAVGPYHATEMLAAFKARYGGIEVTVRLGNSREMAERLLDFSVDVAVLAHLEDDPQLFALPYSRHPVVVFVNARHPWFGRDRVSLAELEGQRVVLRESGSTTRRAFELALEAAGVTVRPVMEIGSREAVWMAVRQGIGIGVVSDIEFFEDPELRKIPICDAEVYTYAHVVCLAERKDSRLIGAFLEVVEDLRAVRLS